MALFNITTIVWEFEKFKDTWVRLMPDLENKVNQCFIDKEPGFTYVWHMQMATSRAQKRSRATK